MVLDPGCQPLAGGWELLARGTPHDAGHAVPIWHPSEREAQKGEAPLLARVKTAAPTQMGFLWCHLEVACRQPFGQHSKKPFRLLLQAEGTPPGICLAAQPCFSPTAWLHHLLKPYVQGIVQRDSGEDGRDRTAWRRPSLGMDDLAICVHHTGLPPCAQQVEKGPVVAALAPHVHEPRMVHRLEEAFDSSCYQGALPSVVQVEGEGADRLQRPPSGAIAVTTIPKVLRVDCRSQLRAGQVHPVVFPSGHA